MGSIRDNLERIRERIANAAERNGRASSDVRLLAVSKTFPAEDIVEAMKYGQTDFGENRVQELAAKTEFFQSRGLIPPKWHLIGHIQTNKAGKAAELADCIHSVDSFRLYEKLARQVRKHVDILVELNMSREENKTGMTGGYDALAEIVEAAMKSEFLHLKGLMTMAECDAGEAAIRGTFAALREFRDRAEKEFSILLPELSMGMSNDFEYAIAEGATVVRVGSAVFGNRDYSV